MQWSPKHWNLTSTRPHFGPSQPGDAFAFWHQKGPMFLAGWNHHSSSSFRIQPWTINGFVQGKIQVFVCSQHLPLTVNIGCLSAHPPGYILQPSTNCLYNWAKPLPQRVLCHGLPLWISMSWKSWPFKSPEPISAQATRMNLFGFVRTLWENIPNPVKMMGKRPKSRENHGETPQNSVIRHQSSYVLWKEMAITVAPEAWSRSHHQGSRQESLFVLRGAASQSVDGRSMIWSSHYDSGFTVVGIYIFYIYKNSYEWIPLWVIYYNIM